MSEAEEQPTTIQLEEEEGRIAELEESLFFKKIGDALPLQPNPFSYPLEDLPTQALAVSKDPQALFLAHPKGFYVAKTGDVVETAKLMKEKGKFCSIEELSIVDVQVGSVRILAVSKDNSTLAACVGEKIHFFSVASLLSKEQEPVYSCSIDESSHVKDFRWRKKSKSSFLILSNNGALYHGELDKPLKKVMENVDAADWSTEGNSVAVVKKSSLIILSSRFKERFTLSIPFNSCTRDADSVCNIKVDSINWIRQDCVLLGWFQITEDGKEDGYHIQIISSKCGKISEVSSKPIGLSFEGAFAGIDGDLLPCGCGPHLFLNYLEDREVALVANKKNTDEHIILFGWSIDDEHKEAALIELSQDDRWLPKIGLQDNEDDNLIVGFGVDTVSLNEKVEIELGVERKELFPYCILLCLTIDAKLLLFHVAGITENSSSPTENSSSPKTVSAVSDEEDMPAVTSSGYGFSNSISSIEEDREDEAILDTKSVEISQEKLQKGGGVILKKKSSQENELKDYSKTHLQDELSDKETNKSDISHHSTGENRTNELKDFLKTPTHDDLSNKETSNIFSKSFHSTGENLGMVQSVTAKKELRPLGDLPPSPEKKMNANQASQSLMSGIQSSNLDKSSGHSPLFGHGSIFKYSRKPETQQVIPASSASMGTSSFLGDISSVPHSKYAGSLGSDKLTNELTNNSQRASPQSASTVSHGSYQVSSSNVLKSSFSPTEYRDSSSDISNSRVGPTEVSRGEQSSSKVGNIDHVIGVQSSPALQYANLLNAKGTNAGTRYSFNTSGMATSIGEQRLTTGVEKFKSGSDPRSSHVSSNRGSTSHTPVDSKLHLTQGNYGSSKSSYGITPAPEFSEDFDNVDDMAKELDTLLSCIEEEGGFRDACIIFQKNSVLEIENGLEKLSKKCRAWKSKMEEQNEGIEHLLDQTVQVMARKNYIEGIVKQASDSQYWDLWNHQKLNPELELKRRQILKANQDLTNQLIELERHFNTLEINKVDENSSAGSARRGLHSGLKPSRDSQAFTRLYNTMSSQLAAAEHLSESLTKQMAALNIEQPSAKRKSVAKELFESIGLEYGGDSFKSPNVKKAAHSPESVKKLPLSSASAAINEQSRRYPSSVMKSFEPETARRRVSLDRSWASFEPPKTTVKRLLLQEEQPRSTSNKLSLVTNKESSQQYSSVAHQRDKKNSLPTLNSYVNKPEANRGQIQAYQGSQDTVPKQVSSSLPFKWANDFSGKSNFTNVKSSVMQVTPKSSSISSSSVLESALTPQGVRSSRNESFGLASDRSSVGENHVNKFDQSKGQPIQFSNAISTFPSQSFGQARTNAFAHVEKQISPKRIPDEISVSAPSSLNKGDTVETKAGFHSMSIGGVNQEKLVTAPLKNHASLFTSDSSGVNFPKFPQFGTVAKETHLGVSTVSSPFSVSPAEPSPSPPLKPSVTDSFTSLPITTTSSSSVSLVKSEVAVKPFPDFKVQPLSSYSSSSSSTTSDVTQEPMEPKPSGGDINLKSDIDASQSLSLQSKPSSAAPAPEPAPALALTLEPAPAPAPAPAPMLAPPPTPVSADISTTIVADVKKETTDVTATQEDDMEEEASDTTTDLSLGSFGAFGIGSAPTSAAPKPNPFGGTFQSAVTSATSSPLNFSASSGELFRPASFSLQPTQPSQPFQPATQSAFSSPFTGSAPPKSGFGQPANMGAGNQALGSVLGTFGQSRQLGTSPPGAGFGSTTTFGSGFAASRPAGGFGNPSTGGFANPATGGFAGVASTVGGFSGVASGAGGFAGAATGGFAGVASSGGGFSGIASGGGGGGFAGSAGGGGFGGFSNPQGGSPATAAGGGGFGGFSNPQGSGFSAFNSPAGTGALPQQFMQMRK